MSHEEILKLLRMVGAELEKRSTSAEIILAGGAAMILMLGNREGTKDIDADFCGDDPALREAIATVAIQTGLANDWLNDTVKIFSKDLPLKRLGPISRFKDWHSNPEHRSPW